LCCSLSSTPEAFIILNKEDGQNIMGCRQNQAVRTELITFLIKKGSLRRSCIAGAFMRLRCTALVYNSQLMHINEFEHLEVYFRSLYITSYIPNATEKRQITSLNSIHHFPLEWRCTHFTCPSGEALRSRRVFLFGFNCYKLHYAGSHVYLGNLSLVGMIFHENDSTFNCLGITVDLFDTGLFTLIKEI
jgi:hypothetical protein